MSVCVCACAHSASLFTGCPSVYMYVYAGQACVHRAVWVCMYFVQSVCVVCESECVSLPVCLRAGLWAQGLK